MSVGEYRANLNGLNMFFGAVLGFVLTGTEQLNSWQFALVLAMLAGVVVSILYISSSRDRVAYSICTVLLALILPKVLDILLEGHGVVPDKVQPTLLVWTFATIVVEFWSREDDQSTQA